LRDIVEARPNARWSVDFVHDQLSNGRRFRILNVIDDVTKECLAAIADTSISGRRVARELDAIIARRGSKQSDRLAFHCPRKTDAERDLRGVQRPHA
jgi:transposase InsO family protein